MTTDAMAHTADPAPKELGPISREEWERRYAARIRERAGWTEEEAKESAEAASEDYAHNELDLGSTSVVWWGGPSGQHLSPEDSADEEMSYWTDDGE